MRTVSASLFSGCMGLDLGLEECGIETVVTVEKNESARETIHMNRPSIRQFVDVYSVGGADLCRAAGGHIDVVAGGPPCQSFSMAGKRRYLDDPRGMLLLEYVRLVREVHPIAFVMENVRGIIRAIFKGGSLVKWLESEFRSLGYHVRSQVVDALDCGSAQRRQRFIMMGSLRRDPAVLTASCNALPRVLGDVIDDLAQPNPEDCAHFSRKVEDVMRRVPPGGNWKDLPRLLRVRAMGNLKNGGLTGSYRRLSYARPCPTLVTSPTQRATLLCHPEFTRPLSVREYQRVQGFPDEWRLSGSTSEKYRQLGNAVPVPLGMAVGHALRESLQ